MQSAHGVVKVLSIFYFDITWTKVYIHVMKRVETSKVGPAVVDGLNPIAVAAERSGLTQDVLRAWERRYSAVKPTRGPGRQRQYSGEDIERLKLLNSVVRAGRSIGQVSQLSNSALSLLVSEDVEARDARHAANFRPADSVETDKVVAVAMELTRKLDAPALNDHLRRAASLLGAPAFLGWVAAPLMRQIGDEWHADRLLISQEHMASSLLHSIITEIMRGLSHPENAPRILVSTPAGDRHAIGAAIVGASAAAEGWNVTYLGADLPAGEIAAAAVSARVQLVALSIVYVDNLERVLADLRLLRDRLPPEIRLIVGGAASAMLRPELAKSGIRIRESLTQLIEELRAVSR